MSFKNHEQYDALKQCGMSDAAIAELISSNLGIRKRTKEKTVQNPPQKNTKTKKAQPQEKTQTNDKLDYLSYMSSKIHVDLKWIRENFSMLLLLINKVKEQKGIVEILSVGEWGRVYKQLKENYKQFKCISKKDLFEIYLKYLIEYEYYISGKELHVKKGVDLTKSIAEAHFVKGGLKEIMNSPTKGVQMYEYEVVVFQKGVDELGINYEDINLPKIEKECGKEVVQIRIQNPLDYGFNIRKLTNICHKMTIKQYCDYQRHVNDEEYKQKNFSQQLKHGKIFFGVNFQPSRLEVFSQLWKHFQGNFLGYRQHFDLLSYLDHDIPGCSSPQFYLKVKGCWTGGHQQNINMCAVNVNHGPDASEWYTVPYEYVEKVRAVLKQKFKLDLYGDEGLWFQKINWFVQNGYPIKRILQKKGDIVISGPGTLHWVRSFGIALQSAWNVFPTKYYMIQAALHRHHENETIYHDRAGTIPLKSLILKYLDHQMFSIDEKTLHLILVSIEGWKNKEERLRLNLSNLYNLELSQAVLESLTDLQSICLHCKQQIFNYFVDGWEGAEIACLSCLENNREKYVDKVVKLHYKYDPKVIKSLFDCAQNRQKYRKMPFETKICNGTHIGHVKCEAQLNRSRKRQRQTSQNLNIKQNNQAKVEKKTFGSDQNSISSEKVTKKIDQAAQTQQSKTHCSSCQKKIISENRPPKKYQQPNNGGWNNRQYKETHQDRHYQDHRRNDNNQRDRFSRRENHYEREGDYRQDRNSNYHHRNQYQEESGEHKRYPKYQKQDNNMNKMEPSDRNKREVKQEIDY